MNALDELVEYLNEGETVEAVVFGPWGWGMAPESGEDWEVAHKEPDPPPVPFNKRGHLLTFDEARELAEGWSFDGGFGAPECYATYIWTNQRVLWVTQYDGATSIDSAPRNPVETMPGMPGG